MAAHSTLECTMTETVVGRPFLGVLQHVIGFVDFLEFLFRGFAAGVGVGMMLLREFPKRRFQFFLVRTSADAQHLVIIAFCHTDLAPEAELGPTCSESASGT